MPTFEFTSPEGKSYSVEGPEGATSAQAFQMLQQHLGGTTTPAPTSEGSSIGGVAKSLGTGVAEGAISLAGLPGDIYHMGLRALGDKLTPESAYGSNAIQKSVEGVTGEFYKPQGRAENLANTAGQFLPAIIGGPETMLTKLATRVAAPAIGSEIGEAVGGPVGGLAGALAGAIAGPMAFNRAIKAMRPGAIEPTVDELKAAARIGYKDPEVAAVQIKPDAVNNLAAKIENDLVGQGFRPNNQGQTFGIVNELKGAPGAVAVADLDSSRKALGVIAKEVDSVGMPTANAVAARSAIRHIDDFLPNLQQSELLAGNAAKANPILGEARQNWAAAKRAEKVQTLAANAEINAASANSGANIQNATKQAFKPMLKNNAAKAIGYNAEELAALNNIVRGTWGGSAARAAGNLLGGGGGLGMLASGAVGYEAGGAPGAIAAGLGGRGLKMLGNRSTLNAVARLDNLLRARSPEAIRIAAQNPQIAMQLPPAGARRLQALIAGDHVLSQQLNQTAQANSQQ